MPSTRLCKVSVRTLQTSSPFKSQEDASWSNFVVAAAATASGILGGAATVAACEKSLNCRDPRTYCNDEEENQAEDDVEEKDPMTVFAKLAARREMEEEAQHSMQATSPSAPTPSEMPSFSAHPDNMTEEEARIEQATRKAKQHSGGLKIFSGNGNMALALEIARYLGINLGKATVGRFADGEVNVQIHENVRGKDVYIIQPTCPPVNDNLMELLLMVSTLNRASARRITVVIPYYGYARQDRKMQVCNSRGILVALSCCGFRHAVLIPIFFITGSRPHLGCRCCSSHGGHGNRSRHCC